MMARVIFLADILKTNTNNKQKQTNVSFFQNACLGHSCAQNATCQTGFTQKGYRCICPAGFTGEQCQIGMFLTIITVYKVKPISYRSVLFMINCVITLSIALTKGILFKIYFTEQKTITVCEYKREIIRCSDGGKIQVTFANYGRLNNYTCPHNVHDYQSRTDCRAQTSLARVRGKCQDRNSCGLKPTILLFGEDPCHGIFKYLLVKYYCENKV